MSTLPSVRHRRRQLIAPIALAVGVLFTLGTSAAQIIPVTRPPTPTSLRDELATIARQRWARLGELRTAGSDQRCDPPTAHELVKLLVMDGQWANARSFADVYEARCGEDPEVRRWGNAPRPHARR
jgi:hypothetical protein